MDLKARQQWQTWWKRRARDAWAPRKMGGPLTVNYRAFGATRDQALLRARTLVPQEAWHLRNEPEAHRLHDGRWYAYASIIGDERALVVAA